MVSGTSDRALCPMTGCCHFANVTFNGHIEPQNNGPLYNNEVIGTLTVDGWAVTLFWYSGPAQSSPRCTKCNSPPINSQFTNFILFDVAL